MFQGYTQSIQTRAHSHNSSQRWLLNSCNALVLMIYLLCPEYVPMHVHIKFSHDWQSDVIETEVNNYQQREDIEDENIDR